MSVKVRHVLFLRNFIQQLRGQGQNLTNAYDGLVSRRVSMKVYLDEPIRYAVGNPIEWV